MLKIVKHTNKWSTVTIWLWLTVRHGRSPFLIGKQSINGYKWAISHGDVSHNQRVYCWILFEAVGIIKQRIIAHYHFLPTLEGRQKFIARLPSMCQVGYLQFDGTRSSKYSNNHDANISAPLPTFGNLQKGMSNIHCKKNSGKSEMCIFCIYIYMYIYIYIFIMYIYTHVVSSVSWSSWGPRMISVLAGCCSRWSARWWRWLWWFWWSPTWIPRRHRSSHCGPFGAVKCQLLGPDE